MEMFLADFCQDLRNACERAYEKVHDVLPFAGNAGPSRPSEYERLAKDEGGDQSVRPPETMDRDVALELVDLAVSGVSSAKSSRPGGETFSGPAKISTSKVVSSEIYKELSEPVGKSNSKSASEQLELCRTEESKLFNKIRVFRDEDTAVASGDSIFLVNAKWFDDWSKFVKGGKRPGSIKNASLNAAEGRWNDAFVGLDAKAWGILSDLYKFDVAVEFESI